MQELGLNNIVSLSLDRGDDLEQTNDSPETVELEGEGKTEEANAQESNEETVHPKEAEFDEGTIVDEEPDFDNAEEEQNNTPQPTKKQAVYTSVAKMLQEEGILPDVTDEEVDNVTDAESMAAAIKKQISKVQDYQTRRVQEALNYDADIDQVREYEATLMVLDGIDPSDLDKADDETIKLRNDLIYQDYINRGFSEQKALKELKKSITAGTAIEDAQEALESNRQYFRGAYTKLLTDARQVKEAKAQAMQSYVKSIEDDISSDQGFFKELAIDDKTRKKIAKVVTAPSFRQKNGAIETELQHYYREHQSEYVKYMGMFYVMTDGFKNLDKLVSKRVRSEQKKGLRRLDDLLNSTSRKPDGSLNLVQGAGDKESYYGTKWKLDV